jgi:hypothetical protein
MIYRNNKDHIGMGVFLFQEEKPPTLEMTQQSTNSHSNKKRWGNCQLDHFCDIEFHPSECQAAANIKQP